jgi:hypothetical protein
MAELVSVMIGWALTKILDVAFSGLARISRWLIATVPFVFVRRDYIIELEHKAKCLAVLKKAYDGLDRGEVIQSDRQDRVATWRQ